MKMIRNCDLDKKVSVKVILKHLYPYFEGLFEDEGYSLAEWDSLVEKMLDEEERNG